jgi:hypothetical protein
MSFNYENILIVIIIFGIGFIISNTIGINIIEGHGEDTIQNICNTPESKLCYGINDGSCNMNTRKQLNYVLDEKSKNTNNLKCHPYSNNKDGSNFITGANLKKGLTIDIKTGEPNCGKRGVGDKATMDYLGIKWDKDGCSKDRTFITSRLRSLR